MKVLNGSESNFDPGGNRGPWLFYGDAAPGTDRRFTDAPLNSMYWDVANYNIYIKTANTGAAADWKPLVAAGRTTAGNTTITGDLVITGTVTAGDIVATAG